MDGLFIAIDKHLSCAPDYFDERFIFFCGEERTAGAERATITLLPFIRAWSRCLTTRKCKSKGPSGSHGLNAVGGWPCRLNAQVHIVEPKLIS
jgi:hypothetical protein